jgi:hypothetical protein
MMRSWKAAGCAALAFGGPGPRVRSHRSGLARRRGTAALRRRTEGAGLSPTDSPAGASPLPIQPSRRSPIAAPPVARSDRQRISERPCDTNRRRARWVREVPESRWSTATFLPLAATSSLFRYFVTCFSRLLPRDPAPTGASQLDARCPMPDARRAVGAVATCNEGLGTHHTSMEIRRIGVVSSNSRNDTAERGERLPISFCHLENVRGPGLTIGSDYWRRPGVRSCGTVSALVSSHQLVRRGINSATNARSSSAQRM